MTEERVEYGENKPTGKTIYIVTAGCYSDYCVVAVFDDFDMAEEFRRRFVTDANEIEKYELNPAIPQLRAGMDVWEVWISREGDVRSVGRGTAPHNTTQVIGYALGKWRNVRGYVGDKYGLMQVNCWARDEDHAVKIAGERRRLAIASGEWPEVP